MKSKRKAILKLFTTLVIITSIFLFCWVLSRLPWGLPGSEESIAGSIGLLTIVVICVPIGFWKAFTDTTLKTWTPSLVVGLLGGAVLFFFSALLYSAYADPPSIGGSIIAEFCLAAATIFGLAGILAVILALDDYFADADLKDEMDKYQLLTKENS